MKILLRYLFCLLLLWCAFGLLWHIRRSRLQKPQACDRPASAPLTVVEFAGKSEVDFYYHVDRRSSADPLFSPGDRLTLCFVIVTDASEAAHKVDPNHREWSFWLAKFKQLLSGLGPPKPFKDAKFEPRQPPTWRPGFLLVKKKPHEL